MKKYGVIGFPVKHSFSPAYFAQKFNFLGITDCEYAAYELSNIVDIKELIARENLAGFNVTIPYKQTIIPYLDHISEAAAQINAVNTITVKNGKWYGDNTDHIGFSSSLMGLMPSDETKALIFGTGGSSLAVRYALNQMGISYNSVSRGAAGDYTYDEITLSIVKEHRLLINTTPLGMYPRVAESVAIPYEAIGDKHLCYDLVYTPEETEFLCKAKAKKATIKNGLEMLEIQADEAWDIWKSYDK
ncbi:MAG: shikimate dehydrogenase [Bacteroidia bacterium]|jgi:shikimate dehydrogenase|tara:strand:+ start:20750 stop:21484 length:735 start_codon:yes stop_codon:yes gene_type:complete